ncbi:MAG: PilZ domain-containing protein [Gammaproteobacteria bacterium]
MANSEEHFESIDDMLGFDPDCSESKFINQRSATRYIRNDIKTVLYSVDLLTSFGFNFFRRLIPVQLLDISTRGMLISTDRKLKTGAKIVLGLKFNSGKSFRIKAVVVRKSTESNYEYGIRFNDRHDDLGDYLVDTQRELRFK